MNAADLSGPADAQVQLLQKLHSIAKAIAYVEKRGRNTSQNYNFASATDVLRDTRRHLLRRKVLVIPAVVPGSIQHLTETGGRSFVTTFDAVYTFMDVETGASLVIPWVGAGADLGGEKGVYKAMTGGLKYLLLQTFLLPTSDDPENDALTQQPQPEEQEDKANKDAERPAAPRIPVDRAKLILDAALEAGLAKAVQEAPDDPTTYQFTPVLKAVLATSGVSRIGELNVDQAEAVEAFIAAEVAEAGGSPSETPEEGS